MRKLKSFNKHQIEIIKEWWEYLEEETEKYYETVRFAERRMANEVGIKDLEFFRVSGEGYVGVGNARRTYKLWQKKR